MPVNITITIPDAAIPRLQAAVNAQFERLEGETDGQLLKRIIREYIIQQVVCPYERRQAAGAVSPDGGLVNP